MNDGFLYQKLYDTLCERIQDGSYPVGSTLPSEKKLREDFDVSAITVQKALSMLVNQGFVRRIPGKGTFVEPQALPPADAPGKTPKIIGLILEHVASPFGLSMLYRMDEVLGQAGYKLCFRFSYCDQEKETEEIQFLLSLGVCGMIIMPSHGQHYNASILKLVLDDFPVILVDKILHGIDVPSVRTDNVNAMSKLVEHMKKAGCKSIGLITTDEQGAASLKERRKGFYQGLLEQGLPTCEECRLPQDPPIGTREAFDQRVEAIASYMKREHARLDGVICSEYGIVRELVQAARQMHLSLERDLMVCCIDEDDLSPNGFTFSHMKQDESAIAEKAVELLLMQMNHQKIPQQDYLIPAIFREKNSFENR